MPNPNPCPRKAKRRQRSVSIPTMIAGLGLMICGFFLFMMLVFQ